MWSTKSEAGEGVECSIESGHIIPSPNDNIFWGTGETVQELKNACCSCIRSSFSPGTHVRWVTIIFTSHSRGSNALSGLRGACTCHVDFGDIVLKGRISKSIRKIWGCWRGSAGRGGGSSHTCHFSEDSDSIPSTHPVPLQTCITPVPGDLMPSSDPAGTVYTWHTGTCRQNTHTENENLEFCVFDTSP